VVGFLVDHLSELQKNRQEEVLLLPYRLLREVLKSDRLTSLSEEEIWQVCGPQIHRLKLFKTSLNCLGSLHA